MKDILKLLSTFFICLIGIGFTACDKEDKEDKDESFIDIKFENDGLY